MLCEQLMKQDVACLSRTDTAEIAAQLMEEHNVGFLPVCDASRKVIGTLTDRDLAIRLVARGLPTTMPVDELMTKEVVACRPTDNVRHAEQIMGQHRKSRIMCIDDADRLVGVISLSDIAQHEGSTRTAATLRLVTTREVQV
jgi:CBS domain-containing protein